MKRGNLMSNTKKCINIEIKITTSYGIGEEPTSTRECFCKKKDENLYSKLQEMGYDSSFFTFICPFYSLYPNHITECPYYKEGTK